MADAEILVKIVDQTRGGMSTVKRNLDGVNNSAKQTNTTFLGLNRAVGAFAAALSIGAITQFGNSVQNLQNRLNLLPASFGSTADNLDRIRDIANATQQPLDATADLFQKVARQADRYGISADQAGIVTQTFADVLRLAGADAAAADGAIRQFGQALGSGTLRGDEFNSILEASAGEILPILARELGVTEGQVRSMAEQGRITGDVLIRALGNSADEVASRTGQMSVTIGGALTTLQNNFLVLGTQATPVLDAVAQGILFIANNLESAIIFAGSFVAAFSVAKLAAAVSALGGLRAAILAVNTAIMANPVGLIATGIAVAITGIITYWDELKFAVQNAFTFMEIAYQKFVIAFTQGMEDAINGVYNAFVGFKDNVNAIFSGLGAAIMDPLNATEAFAEAMEESLSEAAQNTTENLVDFSGSLVDNKARLSELEQELAEAQSEFDQTTQAANNAANANQGVATSFDNVTDTAAGANAELQRAQANYDAFIADLERTAELAQFDSAERQRQITIYKALELRAKALGKTVAELGDAEVESVTRTTEAILDRQEAYEAERELQEERRDFIEDTADEIVDIERNRMNEVQRLEAELAEFQSESRRLGVQEHETTQDRILAYETQIADARGRLEEDLQKQRQDLINDTKSEYSSLYGFMGDKLQEFTGISSKEFGLINDVTKLVFGTNIQGIFDETFTQGILGVQGFRDGVEYEMPGVSTAINTEMSASSKGITSTFQTGLTNSATFVQGVLNNFTTLGGGIINVLGTAFEFLTGGFSSIFGSLGNLIGGFFNFAGNLLGSIPQVAESRFITDNTVGFLDKGGYIPPGMTGIAGENGPEIIRGPATVTSTDDTADILGNMGGNMNVTFNISTVDAQGFDELLTSRRDVITDLIRTSVVESPSRQLRGVY